jgi:hypothetical protein
MEGQISMLELMRRLGAATEPRPFYIIAHACNHLVSVKNAVQAGCNAIECDIRRATNFYEEPEWEFTVRHDPIGSGESIKLYLDGLVKILQKNPQVAVVYFDIKDADVNTKRLLEIIREHLTNIVPVNVVLSHANFAGREMFNPLVGFLRDPGEGVVIDEHDSPQEVRDFFKGKIARFGYGNGVFVVGVPKYIPNSILEGVALKWLERDIRWVYTFTLVTKASMRDYIAKGVDGIMSNCEDLDDLKAVFNESKAKYRLRLATRADDPFAAPMQPAYVLTVKTSSKWYAGTDANLTFQLNGSEGTISATIDAFPSGLFEEGYVNRVTLIGKDVGTINELVLSQDGTWTGPDWSVDTVTVHKKGSPTVTFKFFQEIATNTPVKRTPA